VATRDITQADPELQDFFAFAKRTFELEFPDFIYKSTCVYRSPDEQLIEFKHGRSQLDGTRKVGKHNRLPARAFDGGIFRREDGAYIDTIPGFPASLRKALYAFVWLLAQKRGLRAGGDWDNDGVPVDIDPDEHLNDPYHIEMLAALAKTPKNRDTEFEKFFARLLQGPISLFTGESPEEQLREQARSIWNAAWFAASAEDEVE